MQNSFLKTCILAAICWLSPLTPVPAASSPGGQSRPQTAPADSAQEATTDHPPTAGAVPPGGKPRPQACTDGRSLGPIRVQVGTVQVGTYVGKTISVPVRVKGVCDLAAFSFWLTYDHNIVELVEVAETPFLAGSPPVDITFVGLRPGARLQTIQGRRPEGAGGVDGVGTLARLVFRGRVEGRTDVSVVRLRLQDPEGVELPSNQVPVNIMVLPVPVTPGDPRDRRPSRNQRP